MLPRSPHQYGISVKDDGQLQMKTSFRIIIIFGWLLWLLPSSLLAQANMRREGALTLVQTSDDTKGFYAATIDPSNGFAYFAAKYVYKVNLATPLPTQVGAGVSLGRLAYSGVMDSPAGCAYFAVGANIYQILANGTNAPSPGSIMVAPFGSSAFVTQLLLDTTDPANHYLYAMTETGGTSSILYKLALNNFPNTSAIIGSAAGTVGQPALGYGVIDLTNSCAYYGSFIGTTLSPYLAKFALGSGANGPTNLGGISLDLATNRAVGGIVLDIANGYGYCDSDDTDNLFGHARVYKWALNGAGAPALVSYVDMHTNEGFCHVAAFRPANGLLYFASDLSYPCYFYRFRLPPGTNAPVETGNLPLLSTTNLPLPAWGTNPTTATNWGEVFARSIADDTVRDFVYIGRDCADAQVQPYTDQIVKVALDRDETMVAFTEDMPNTNNPLPYRESFEEYTNGFSLVGTNGWNGEDSQMGLVETNSYSAGFTNIFPIPGAHSQVLQVDGAVTNSFPPSTDTNVFVDMILQGKYWTDPLQLTFSNAAIALCVTTNGHLAVWNCTNPPNPGIGWTELADTSIASNQFFRVTLDAAYGRDVNNEFYYRFWINGVPSTNPQTWYAAADTNQNYFGALVAQGRFALDDLVVTAPAITITNVTYHPNGSVSLFSRGMPGLPHRLWATTSLNTPTWSPLSTNQADANGLWEVTDTNALNYSARFYRASLP
jgi:hypothetical protein